MLRSDALPTIHPIDSSDKGEWVVDRVAAERAKPLVDQIVVWAEQPADALDCSRVVGDREKEVDDGDVEDLGEQVELVGAEPPLPAVAAAGLHRRD